MSLTKAIVIIVVAILAASTIRYVFGGTPDPNENSNDFWDNEDTKILREKEKTVRVKEQEKTKQLYYQFKIDSLRAAKNNGK